MLEFDHVFLNVAPGTNGESLNFDVVHVPFPLPRNGLPRLYVVSYRKPLKKSIVDRLGRQYCLTAEELRSSLAKDIPHFIHNFGVEYFKEDFMGNLIAANKGIKAVMRIEHPKIHGIIL